MIQVRSNINTPVRTITAKVELYNGSTLATTYNYTDALASINIERVGEESKFFGFGICQKLNVKLIDVPRAINISTANSFKVYFNDTNIYPTFSVTEVNRAENTNQLSITAYDLIAKASAHTVSELGLVDNYSIRDFAIACVGLLGASGLVVIGVGEEEACFDTVYEAGANFEGTETIRSALDAIAEATQTIYYVDNENNLVFKRLDVNGEPVLSITKEDYFVLDSSTNKRLGVITHATELGDNVSAAITQSGSTQFVRDNPFWDLANNIGELVDAALAAVGGMTVAQFECDWRGNYLLEVGDKISLQTKDNETIYSYVVDDVVSYDGSMSEQTRWSYADSEAETADNPSSLGDVLKQTYAKVDKVNKEIELIASETDANKESIANLQIDTTSISATVQSVEKFTTEAIEGINEELAELSKSVETKLNSDSLSILIKSLISDSVTSVETNTGFKFNDEGLNVTKTGSEMSTLISEDGMTVSKSGEVVLTANNTGVDAVNLRATTYLVIGKNSRFEDYGSRTGCFWVGEVSE